MKKLVIGILAHVDAGKTTLAEGILYLTGSIRKLGRVDHKDAFLDTHELERARGITIFSKQAVFKFGSMEATLLDTPGHADFSGEMERTLQVLDYAILVISGSDGVQGHTQTLWRLLSYYKVPTFIFINKMDLAGCDREELANELKARLSDGCIDFTADTDSRTFAENIAMCDEALLDKYINGNIIENTDISGLISARKVYPCYFGSALKLEGVLQLLEGLDRYTLAKGYRADFGAKIYKIARDEQGNRLTFMKITGGSLKVKMLLTNRSTGMSPNSSNRGKSVSKSGHEDYTTDSQAADALTDSQSTDTSGEKGATGDIWEEKADQIRIYSGAGYTAVDEAEPGTICAVTGLTATFPGQGLGTEAASGISVLEPVLVYRLILPPGCSAFNFLPQLRKLEEEDPLLHILWSEQLKEIHVKLMGEVQVEILKSIILERFGINVEFGRGNIVYKETIAEPVTGSGHFEPLRHYAEVHLLLEPGRQGSGLTFDTLCSEDELEAGWQRLILSHLRDKEHIGVLTGSPITDMKISLIAGRAHLKHTEGGDFRQAAYRALRQGLMKAKSILLEPYYDFRLEIPSELVGKAMSDIQRMSGRFNPPELHGDMALLEGSAPVSEMSGYQTEMMAYTRGRGRLFCSLKGYFPCHNPEDVINEIAYDSLRDVDNPASSVFCSHGAGFIVDWDKADEYMHIDIGNAYREPVKESVKPAETRPVSYGGSIQEDKELEEIFERTYGPIKQRHKPYSGVLGYEKKTNKKDTGMKVNPERENEGEKANSEKEDTGMKASPEQENTSSKANPEKDNTGVKTKPVKYNASAKTNPVKDNAGMKERSQLRPGEECLIVDGYNIIFAWEELRELAGKNLDAARGKLMDILCNYQGFKKCMLILVFDAYKVKEGMGSIQDYHNIHVVYTREAETADQYIEKVTHKMAGKYRVTVATSDALEQVIIMGKGAIRMSADEFIEEVLRTNEQIRRDYLDRLPKGRSFLGEHIRDNIPELHIDDKS